MNLRSGDATLFYEREGSGTDLVLLHPYPANHRFWARLRPALAQKYRLLIPDLRGHGASEPGEGPVSMQKLASDLLRLCDESKIQKAIFFGVSIGGYLLFEFWRRHRERVKALVLCDTRAEADNPQGREMRYRSAKEVEEQGADDYMDGMTKRLLGESTQRNRPDLVAEARGMMAEMKIVGVAAVLRGMAERRDSRATLPTITVPTLVMVGEEDKLTPPEEAEIISKGIRGSKLARIPAAGHYAPFEQHEQVLKATRSFLDSLPT